LTRKRNGGARAPPGFREPKRAILEGGRRRAREIGVGRSSSSEGMPKGSLSVLLVGRDEVRMGQARDVLRALGEPRLVVAEKQPAKAAALSAEADVAMMVFGGDEEEGLNYLQKESERTRRPVLFALLNEQSEALMRRVLRAGADEVLFAPLAPGDLMRPLLKVSEALRATRGARAARRFP
jgi:DNA-binding response OmpR family regulator